MYIWIYMLWFRWDSNIGFSEYWYAFQPRIWYTGTVIINMSKNKYKSSSHDSYTSFIILPRMNSEKPLSQGEGRRSMPYRLQNIVTTALNLLLDLKRKIVGIKSLRTKATQTCSEKRTVREINVESWESSPDYTNFFVCGCPDCHSWHGIE